MKLKKTYRTGTCGDGPERPVPCVAFTKKIINTVKKDRKMLSAAVGLIILCILLAIPTGYEEAAAYKGVVGARTAY